MRVDLRVKHDIEARKAAIGLFELGHGYKSAAIALSLPAEAVRRWQEIYRAFGSEVLLRMDGKQGRYTYEQKVAAASAVVDGGMTKTEAMAAFGIMSMSPLKKWCALYREGGAEALRPRPKGRPSGSRARPRTREEELEERCRRLEAEVAYLKKLRALVERDGLDQGEGRSGLATLMWTVPGGARETGGPYMRDPRHPRHFTDEFKRQIVDLYNAGKPKREIMDEYDLGKSTVERWIKSINATGSPRAADNRTPEQNRILELERENRRLRMEVDVLKRAALIYARK